MIKETARSIGIRVTRREIDPQDRVALEDIASLARRMAANSRTRADKVLSFNGTTIPGNSNHPGH